MPVALAISAALYTLLALAFTFPLITHLDSAILRGIGPSTLGAGTKMVTEKLGPVSGVNCIGRSIGLISHTPLKQTAFTK